MHQHRQFEIGLLWGLAVVIALCACSSQPSRRDSRMAEATREIGEAYMRQGDYTAALRELMNAKTLNPNDPIVYHDLGICYMVKNRFPDAIANFKQAIALKPSYAPARNNLGTAYLRLKEWDAAIEVFEEITKDALYATPHFPLSNLGLAYYHKGEYSKSLDYYKQALRVQDNFVNALRGAGRTYLAMNEGRMALRYLTRAVRQAPKVAGIHYDLGDANLLVGNIDQAIASYETALELAPQESEVAIKAKQRVRSLMK